MQLSFHAAETMPETMHGSLPIDMVAPTKNLPSSFRMPGVRNDDTPDLGETMERRRRKRVSMIKTIKLYDATSGRYFAGHTCDVSEAGMQIELPAKVPARAGHTALVYVAGPGDRRQFLEHTSLVPVRFVWVRRNPTTGTACCGVELLADTTAAAETTRRAA